MKIRHRRTEIRKRIQWVFVTYEGWDDGYVFRSRPSTALATVGELKARMRALDPETCSGDDAGMYDDARLRCSECHCYVPSVAELGPKSCEDPQLHFCLDCMRKAVDALKSLQNW